MGTEPDQRGDVSGYQFLDHTADVGLTAWGPGPAEAFVEAAHGMFAIMLGDGPVRAATGRSVATREVAVDGRDWSQLLVNWLAELLFWYETERLIPLRIDLAQCAPPRCVARVEGVLLSEAEQSAGIAIKAVTYHHLAVNIRPERTDLRVIFDI